MGDMKEDFDALKGYHRERRQRLGVPCAGCQKKFPKANPKILLPGQKCFCGYRDERPDDREGT